MEKEIIWTIEKIKKGFEKFFELHKRYPTAYDVDDFEFLPSARQIQRRFGGLVALRKELGLSIDNYSRGDSRSKIAIRSSIYGRKYEAVIYNTLLGKFDEKLIHIERPIITYDGNYNSKSRYDFYVYAKPHNFAIDVVCSNDHRTLIKNLNLKENKYNKTSLPGKEILYFVYFVENINSKKFDTWNNKRVGIGKFPSNWKIMNLNEFRAELDKYETYRILN